MCSCNLCQARELNCDPNEIYFGIDSLESKLVRSFPGYKIYQYEVAYLAMLLGWPMKTESDFKSTHSYFSMSQIYRDAQNKGIGRYAKH